MSSTTKPKLHLPGWLHDLLERHLDEDIELPILPEVSARVIALCEDEKANAKAIEAVLERDPSLASPILRIANSSAYAPQEPIVSLQQAVSRLGLATIRNIVLAVSLQGRVFKVAGQQTRVRSIWLHCAVTAAFGREIARKQRRNVEAAFLCGLLHDIGRPIVLQATVDALAHRTKEALPPALLETAMDEFHEDVAGRMVEAWKLADWTVAAVTHHHHPEKAAPHEEHAHIAYLADQLADWATDDSKKAADFVSDDPAFEPLNLYPEDIEALLAYRGKALEVAEAFQ
jgi:putative nucleotidyltransferase with HDIG domain